MKGSIVRPESRAASGHGAKHTLEGTSSLGEKREESIPIVVDLAEHVRQDTVDILRVPDRRGPLAAAGDYSC